MLLIEELIQYEVVLSGEMGAMDVSVIDTMHSLAEVMTSEIERPVQQYFRNFSVFMAASGFEAVTLSVLDNDDRSSIAFCAFSNWAGLRQHACVYTLLVACVHCWSAWSRVRAYTHARQQGTPTNQSADNHVMLT